jgi:NAD/NADP transhydrogenase beta subunit
MKTASYGRIVFGGSAVLFGVIALMWYDSDTWQTLRQIWSLPFGTIIGGCLMMVQIGGGIGMQYPRTARLTSILLVVVYSLFSLACTPGILAAPAVYANYGSFFEQFSLLCGAIALYGATEATEARAVAFGRVACLGLAVCTVSFTLSQILYFRVTADLVPTWIPPNQTFWAILTTIAFALAAIAILFNRQARLAIRLMTLMLALFGVLVWIPRLIAHPEAHLNWSEFGLTFLITGAAWMVADSISARSYKVKSNDRHASGSRNPIRPL